MRPGKKAKKPRPVDDEPAEHEQEQEQEQEHNDDGASIEDLLADDIDNFKDQPLTREEAPTLVRLAGDWDSMLRQIRHTAIDLAKDVGSHFAEVSQGKDGESAEKQLRQVDTIMRELLDTQAELVSHKDVLEDLNNRIVRGEQISNAIEQYNGSVTEKIQTWSSKTSRQKYGKNDDYRKFKENIFQIQRPNESMPVMSSYIPQEPGDDSDDDDLEVGGATQQLNCPILMTVMKDPMISELCGHSYSKLAIYDYLKNGRKPCPATGCNRQISKYDLKPNKEIERLIKTQERIQKRREAEASVEVDDDDVIE